MNGSKKGILIDQEVDLLAGFFKSRRDQQRPLVFSEDIKFLLAELAKVNGGVVRKEITVWSRLKRMEAKADGEKGPDRSAKKSAAEKKPSEKIKILGLGLSARKLLDELSPIMGFMGKPANYLAPFEVLLSQNAELAGRLKAAEEKNAVSQPAVAKIKELEGEVKKLAAFLTPAKILLRETCDLRMQAASLTRRTEELKKKNGTDLFEFLQSLEDCGSLIGKKVVPLK